MISLALRNLKIFFRDRTAVFFSLLAVFIIIGLYVLFLGDLVLSDLDGVPSARFLMDSWIMAGLLAVTSVTTTLGAAGVVVDDQAKGIAKDFQTSPLKRTTLVGGYVVSIMVVGMVMTVVALLLAELYIVGSGGEFLPLAAFLKVLGLIVLSTLTSGSIVFFLVSFFRTQSAFGVASTVVGTLIGFLMGIYVPLGVLPSSVQLVVKLFPMSHAAVLFRQVFMQAPLAQAFAGAPGPAVDGFQTSLGVVFQFGGRTISPLTSIAVLAVTALLFFTLGVWRMLAPPKR